MTVEITAVLEAAGRHNAPGYADSLVVTPDRLYVREAYGASWFGHGLQPQRGGLVDLEQFPAWKRVGDGQQSVTSIAASEDGTRLLLGYKHSEHSTCVVRMKTSQDKRQRDGQIVGEFGFPRQLGGVAVTKVGAKYAGYSLGYSLRLADVTTPAATGRTTSADVAGAPAGWGLEARNGIVAYCTQPGRLVLVMGVNVYQSGEEAFCLALDDTTVLLGVANGMRCRPISSGAPRPPTVTLPSNPSAVALLDGVSYAWCVRDGKQRLYRESEEILTLPGSEWPVKICKGLGSQLYCGTERNVLIVRVS